MTPDEQERANKFKAAIEAAQAEYGMDLFGIYERDISKLCNTEGLVLRGVTDAIQAAPRKDWKPKQEEA